MKDKELRTAWRTLMAVMQETGYFDMYDEEENKIVNALWELEELRKCRDKAIEYIKFHSSGIITENAGIVDVVPSFKILEILKGEINE